MTKQEILQNSAESITFAKYFDGVRAVPTAATVSIMTSAAADLPTPILNVACTIDSVGYISYAMLAANTASLAENLRATFTYTVDSVSYTDVIYFDVVKKRLNSTVIDQDLIDEFSVLDKLTYRIFCKATSATGSNLKHIIDNLRLNGQENEYKGCELSVLSGNSANFISTITAFDKETRTLYIADNLPFALAIGDSFLIRKSFKTEIARAFDDIKDYIRTQGYRPALVIDDTQLREAHIALSICKVLLPLGETHRYDYEEFKKKYAEKIAALKLTYDTDESGGTDETETDVHAGQIRLRR
jgi:hypothetical protein